MADKEAIHEAFCTQAEICEQMGSPVTAGVLRSVAENYGPDSAVGRRMLAIDGDLSGAGKAVPLRVAGGLHALARAGEDDALAAAYRGEDDLEPAVADALEKHDEALAEWIDRPPQTNEVGRAAVIMAGLMVAADRYPLPVDLLELGSSAGLVLNLARYRYDLGGVVVGEETSPLFLKPDWEGPPPPATGIDIVTQRGVDRNPVYLSTPEAAERLVAYIWPDQRERIANTERAIRLARAFTPPVIAGEGDEWAERRLATPQAEGVLRILFHTVALQYFSADARARVEAAVQSAGAQATEARPFGHLVFEHDPEADAFRLRLRLWPSGEDLHLADAHPHGNWIRWFGASG